MLPFSTDVFFYLFEQYNRAIWPAQPIAYALGLLALVAAFRPFAGSSRVVCAVLALGWLWNGIAYHLMHFTQINFWAYGFAALFIVQGLLFAWSALRGRLEMRFVPDAFGWTGLVVALFALLVYPVIAWLAGHGWPRAPMFGVAPAPTTIFTWALLLMSMPRTPLHLTIIPLIWSLIGGAMAYFRGVPEDLALPLVAVTAVTTLAWRNRRVRKTTTASAELALTRPAP
jgi:Family of unknown function (DUF6064)